MKNGEITVAVIANRIVCIPALGFGGIERFLYPFILLLQQLGVRVIVYTVTGSNIPGAEVVSLAEDRLNTDFTDYLTMSIAQVGKAYELISERDDIDLIHGNTGFESLFAWTVPQPTVCTLHNGYEQAKFFGLEFTTNVHNIALTSSELKILRNAGVPVMNYIYYDVDCEYLVRSTSWQSPGKELRFMGRRNPQKGLRNAIEIALETGYRLLIAGPPPEAQYRDWYATYIQPRIDRYPDLLVDVGLVGDADKPAFYEGAAAFMGVNQCYEQRYDNLNLVVPAWYEPLGVVFVESMAAGVQVVATFGEEPNVSSIPELVQDNGSIFLSHSDEETIEQGIQAVRSLTHSPEKFLSCQRRASDFFPPAGSRRYLEAFRRVLNA